MLTALGKLSIINQMLADGTLFDGTGMYVIPCKNEPLVNPPQQYADIDPILVTEILRPVLGPFGAPIVEENGDVTVTTPLLTRKCVAAHSPQTITGWLITNSAGGASALAYVPCQPPIVLLGDDSAVQFVVRLRFGDDVCKCDIVYLDA